MLKNYSQILENETLSPIITKDYLELLEDYDYPYLYIGKNSYNVNIIGSFVEEDEEDDNLLWYIHTLVDEKTINHFRKKNKSYREILNESQDKYLIGKTYTNKIKYKGILNYIPEDYMPKEDTLCPSPDFNFGLDFSVVLKGKNADKHLIESNTYLSFCTNFGKVLREGCDLIEKTTKMTSQILQKANEAGSFKINFNIEFKHKKGQQDLFFNFDSSAASKLISSIIETSSELEYEDVEIITGHGEIINKSDKIQKIEKNYDEFCKLHNIQDSQKDIDNLYQKISNVCNIFSNFHEEKFENDFESISVINTTTKNQSKTIAFIDEETKQKISEVSKTIEELKIYRKDENPSENYLYIYDLDTKKRKGKCKLYETVDTKPSLLKDRGIQIDFEISKENTDNIPESKLTESLHFCKIVNVQGRKAYDKKDKIKKIFIDKF